MMRLFLFLLIPILAETAVAPKEYVTLGKIKPIVVRVGHTQEVQVPGTVLKGHHIQANPATLPNLIATELDLEKIEGLEVSAPTYPQSKPWKLNSAGKVIQTYEGNFLIKVALTAKSLQPGKYEVKGSLRYQACDEKNCFFPTSAPVAISVSVVK